MKLLCCMLKAFAKCSFCNEQWCASHWLPNPHDHRAGGEFETSWICPKYNKSLTWKLRVANPGILIDVNDKEAC